MTGTPVETGLAFVPAGSLTQKFLAFLDRFGDGSSLAPMHAPIDTTGARIDPATSERQDAAATLLGQILAAIQATRAETVWTDDSGAYYIRIDNGGTLSWVTPGGAASSGPGAGDRPASGSSVVVDRAAYQATASGTGFASGDLLDHFVTADPASGAMIANFWLNITQGTTLSAPPSSASISQISILPPGAATAANQVTQATSLSSILAALLAAPTAAQAGSALGPAAALGVVQQDGQQFTVSASSAGPMIGTGANATTGAYAGDGAASVAVQRTDATANATAFEVSDDGVTWTLQNGYQPNSAGNNVEFATQSAGGSYHYPINHKYFRVRLSTFVSGTATAVITLKVAPLPPIAMYVTPSNAGTAATSANQARAIAFTDTQTALAASGAVTNTARATGIAQGSTGLYGYFNVNAFADQAGTLFIEGSIDNFASTTFPMNGTAGTALTAGGSVSAKIAVTMPYMRTRYTNGTTAQTKFSITSSFSAA